MTKNSKKSQVQSANLVEFNKFLSFKKVSCDFILGKENFHIVYLTTHSNNMHSVDLFLNGPLEEVLTMSLFVRYKMPACVVEVYPC